MNLLLLIPGLFTLLDRVIGPLFTNSHRGAITSALFSGGFTGTLDSLMSIITGTIGQLESAKIAEIRAQAAILISQAQIEQIDAAKGDFFNFTREMLAFGLSVLVLVHLTIAEIYNLFELYLGQPLAPMDTMTTILLCGLLGIYMGSKTVETVNSNN